MSRRYPYKFRILAAALFDATVAAFFEIAIIGHIYGVRHLPGYAVKLVNILTYDRLTLLKTYRIRMQRIFEYLAHGTAFNNFACIHYVYIVRHFGYNAEVVRDEHY